MPATITHSVQSAREVRFDAPVAQVRAGLLDALDFALHAPAVAFLGEAAADDADHAVVQAGVEGAALGEVFFVAVFEPAVRVEVTAEFEEEVEGVAGAAGEAGQAGDVGEEFEHAGAEGGGGEGVVQVILEAV